MSVIDYQKTGKLLKFVFGINDIKLRDILQATDITWEQSVYKWFKGQNIPTIEHFTVISGMLSLRIEDLIVRSVKCDFDKSVDFFIPVFGLLEI